MQRREECVLLGMGQRGSISCAAPKDAKSFAQVGGVCTRHGAKKIICSSEGCTNQAVKLCSSEDAQIKLGKEECTRNMEQRRNRQERSV